MEDDEKEQLLAERNTGSGNSNIVLNFKGNKDGDYLSPDEEDASLQRKDVTLPPQKPPLKGIMKKRIIEEKSSTDGSSSGSESEDDTDTIDEETSAKLSISDLLEQPKPIPPPPRNLAIELPIIFRLLLFLNGSELPVWCGSGAGWGGFGCGLWGRGGGGPWEKGSIAAALQYVWTLLHFAIVTYVTVIINVDIYYEFRTYGLPVMFFTLPVPLLVLCMNFYFQRTNSFQGLMKLLNAASTSYISEAMARKKMRRHSASIKRSSDGNTSNEDEEQADDDDENGEFREDSFFASAVTRYTIHIRKAKKKKGFLGKKIHQAIGGEKRQKKRTSGTRKPIRDPRTVNEDDEVVRRVNRKQRRSSGVLVQEEEIEVENDLDGDLLPGEEGEVWYSQPVLDASHVFTLRFFSVAAFFLAALATAATIIAIVLPFVNDNSDDHALIIVNYIACGLVFWWFLTLASFLSIILAISALIIRFVKTVIYVQKFGRSTMHATIGYLQQLDKVIMRAALQLQWPIAICLLCWTAAFINLEYAFFFQSLVDDVALYLIIPSQCILPVFIFFLLKPTSDITHSFGRCRTILFRWATKYGRIISSESQAVVYQDMAILRHLLAKSGWYIFGVQITRKILMLFVLIVLCLLVIGIQHIIHIQFD